MLCLGCDPEAGKCMFSYGALAIDPPKHADVPILWAKCAGVVLLHGR